MAQIVHGPAIFDDKERYPFGTVLCKEYPYPENQGEGFYEPKDPVKDLFVAGLGFVVGDVSKKLPHGLIFPRNAKSTDCRPPVMPCRSQALRGRMLPEGSGIFVKGARIWRLVSRHSKPNRIHPLHR
jgi:hypothetical protein